MAVPSSGPISLLKIAKELKLDDYYDTTTTSGFLQNVADDISLLDMSTGADDFTGDSINTSNPSANRPDGATPHAMSEFFSYDHDYLSPYMYLAWSRTVGSTAASNTLWTDPNNSYNTDDIVNPTGSGTVTRWRQSNLDISLYQGRKIRLVVGFNHGTASFRCDVCLSSFYLTNNVDQYFIGTTEYGYSRRGKVKFRNVVVSSDQNNISPAQNNIMQHHTNNSQSNPLSLGTSVCFGTTTTNCWYDFDSTTDAYGVYERSDIFQGHWNWYDSSNSNYPETISANTGPLNQYFAYDNSSPYNGFMEYEQIDNNSSGYIYYEASGQSSQQYAWFRTVIIDVPEDADKLYFNYCAYSNDQTNWYNSWLKIYVHLVE